ncbi:MAG: hypothetical protein R3222_02410 [Balneolaceae bacterium]|nr:hypothetical protein [Balneolaceae bacterium]
MNSNEQNYTGGYGEPITRKNLRPLYVSLEDMVPDYREMMEQHEDSNEEHTHSV